MLVDIYRRPVFDETMSTKLTMVRKIVEYNYLYDIVNGIVVVKK